MGRYADVDYLLKNNAVKMDWSDQKWVSEVSLVSAINLNVAPVVHGHWEETGECLMCSVCGGEIRLDTDYCPHCGAKMDEKADALNQINA